MALALMVDKGARTVDFSSQLATFIITVLTGMVLGGVFDFYRIMRGVFRPRWVLTSVADLLYWLLATVIVFGALLLGNWGELRLYVFLGLFAGIVSYYRFLSRWTIHLLIGIIRLVGRAARMVKLAIVYSLLKPAGFLLRLTCAPVRYIRRKFAPLPPDQNIPPQ